VKGLRARIAAREREMESEGGREREIGRYSESDSEGERAGLAPNVRLLVLDVLKPHRPSVLEYATELSKIDHSYSVNMRVLSIDERTENAELIVEGRDIDFKKVENVVLSLGGSIQSIDEVCVGARLIDSRRSAPKQ